MPTRRGARAAADEVNDPIFLLEVPLGIFEPFFILPPRRVMTAWAPQGASSATRPFAVIAAGSFGIVAVDHAIGEYAALRTEWFASMCHGHLPTSSWSKSSWLGASLAVPALGRLSAIMLLPVVWWTIVAPTLLAIVPLAGTFNRVSSVLMPTMG